MGAIEIILIIVGVAFIIGSFLAKDKLSNKDIETISQLSEQELKVIVEKQLRNADNKVEEALDEIIEASKEDTKRALEKETNEKIMAVSEYSDTVLESMNKTHNEIMFLYSMLNDKHKDLTDLAAELQNLTDNIKATSEEEHDIKEVTSELEERVVKAQPMKEQEILAASVEQEGASNPLLNHNEDILRLHSEEKSDVDIAKELGLGLGEVKLVIGLFKGDKDEV